MSGSFRGVISYPACFVCGNQNPAGLGLQFFWNGEVCCTEYVAAQAHVGYHDLLHGGITATILDEVMIKAILAGGVIAVTTKLSVEYRLPVTLGERVTFEGRITGNSKRLYQTAGVARSADGRTVAEATGQYIVVKDKKFLSQLSTSLAP